MTPVQDTLFIALKALIMAIVPGVEVIQGLGNGVPTPAGQFICMTASGQRRLRTNVSTYNGEDGTRTVEQGTDYSIQVDCYGPLSSDHATAISTLWLDPYACDMLAPYGCQPLFVTDPSQSALVNGEENYEQRWMVTAVLQFNPVITVSQEFADDLNVSLNRANSHPTN